LSEASDDGKLEKGPEPALAEAPPDGGSRAPRSALIARVAEWFWRGAALREARALSPFPSLDQEELVRRGRLAAEAGARLLEASPPLDAGPPDAVAFELYRQSIYWTLAAAGAGPQTATEATPAASRELFARLPEAVPASLSETRASLSELGGLLGELDFVAVASLPTSKQSELAQRLARVADALLDHALEPARRAETLWSQRLVRVGALLVSLVALAVGLSQLRRRLETDLALGQPWRASSVGHGACTSPAQDCGSEFFFHTQNETGPWLEIDLGSLRTFSEVRVKNRGDCCSERAVPLLVEVSDDRQRFREVARRGEDFQLWSAEFEPVTARYVRLRSPVSTTLHLRQVAVLR
jgi:hypothetical protein